MILVTGASGFLGQELLKLLSSDYKIIAWYNKTKPEFEHRNVFYQKIDLTKRIDNLRVDCVFHLASHVDLRENPDILKMCKVNVQGSINLSLLLR